MNYTFISCLLLEYGLFKIPCNINGETCLRKHYKKNNVEKNIYWLASLLKMRMPTAACQGCETSMIELCKYEEALLVYRQLSRPPTRSLPLLTICSSGSYARHQHKYTHTLPVNTVRNGMLHSSSHHESYPLRKSMKEQ